MTKERLLEVPVPRYRIGQTVFGIGTREAVEWFSCPDCLGSGEWTVRAPTGFESKVHCPRCDGHGKFGLNSRAPFVRKLTVGSIQITTTPSEWDPPVRYMCEETGVGSGSTYPEAHLFLTEEEAQPVAEAAAAKERARLEAGPHGRQRREFRHLSKYQMMTAETKAADRRAWSAEYDYGLLVEKIAGLESEMFLSSYGFDDGEEIEGRLWGGSLDLKPETVRLLQEHLCSFIGERAVEALQRARKDLEEKCKC